MKDIYKILAEYVKRDYLIHIDKEIGLLNFDKDYMKQILTLNSKFHFTIPFENTYGDIEKQLEGIKDTFPTTISMMSFGLNVYNFLTYDENSIKMTIDILENSIYVNGSLNLYVTKHK